MSFLVVAALAVGLLVLAPFLAHLLRRSRATQVEFPPARLVPRVSAVARRPGRLEDRWLFGLRALLVLGLAALGATPLLRCSRLELGRTRGASVAVALVLDDSLSMQARGADGESRWQRALGAARQLVTSARDGDAFAIVLAGSPARLALAATTDLGLVRHTLEQFTPSDRATDLEGAAALGRSSLVGLPQVDHRVLLLSDLSGKPPAPGEPAVLVPVRELAVPMTDCGVASADQQGKQVLAVLACTDPAAARGRSIELVSQGKVVATRAIEARAGRQTAVVQAEHLLEPVDVRLTGKDALGRDDRAPVASQAAAQRIGVVADPVRASVTTGGPTVIEQALAALASGNTVEPLLAVPEEDRELARFVALVVDDPNGLTPESRATLSAWLERGGVALGLLGPASEAGQLGLSLEPFAGGSVHWEPARGVEIDPKSVGWLGEEAQGLAELAPQGRVGLESATLPGARVVARWSDGRAWLVERELGRGLVLTAGLPAGITSSDLALRPGFLALLDHLLGEASRRQGSPRSQVGSVWSFPAAARLEVSGPDGPVSAVRTPNGQQAVSLSAAGRYQVRVDGQAQTRIVRWDPNEILDRPFDPGGAAKAVVVGGAAEYVDVTREVALGVLLLLALEVVARTVAGRRSKGAPKLRS